MRDLLGNEITEEQARSIVKRSRKDPIPTGYAHTPGSGPQDERCGTCTHAARLTSGGKSFAKCSLRKAHWTHSRKTDILLKAPACNKWERAS